MRGSFRKAEEGNLKVGGIEGPHRVGNGKANHHN
jgi:hypothetical protein